MFDNNFPLPRYISAFGCLIFEPVRFDIFTNFIFKSLMWKNQVFQA